MILFLNATTATKDLFVDYIEVKLCTGQTVSLNWDESEIGRTESGFTARYKGVYFDEEYANGRIKELENMKVVEVGLYSDTESENVSSVSFDEMEFWDDEEILYAASYELSFRW